MENITIKEKYNKIIASGLLLPKDKVSRNGVLYDWDTAKATVSKIPGLPMMYNHQNEGMEKPVGHFTDAIALESRPNSGKWQEVWDKTSEELNISEGIPGVYYEADINPDSEYANSVTRGDVRKVSIQIIPEKQVSETMSDGTKYTRAYIKDYVESSIVPSPGFMETNIAVMCESFNIKKEFLQEGKKDIDEIKKIVDKLQNQKGMKVGKFNRGDIVQLPNNEYGMIFNQQADGKYVVINKFNNEDIYPGKYLVLTQPINESFSEVIKVGDKVHSPSGYAKVISINGNKVIVRSNDPSGDLEYDLNQVQKETIEACDDKKEESQTTSNNDVTTTLLKDEDKINEELDEDDYEDLIENLELIELCEKLIYNNKR